MLETNVGPCDYEHDDGGYKDGDDDNYNHGDYDGDDDDDDDGDGDNNIHDDDLVTTLGK